QENPAPVPEPSVQRAGCSQPPPPRKPCPSPRRQGSESTCNVRIVRRPAAALCPPPRPLDAQESSQSVRKTLATAARPSTDNSDTDRPGSRVAILCRKQGSGLLPKQFSRYRSFRSMALKQTPRKVTRNTENLSPAKGRHEIAQLGFNLVR